MSITTELRDYMRDYLCDAPYSSMSSALMSSIYALKSSIASIADRIDQEHEECAGFCHRLEDAASKGEEVTIFGTDYVPLPTDADGEYIHIGDELEYKYGRFVVSQLTFYVVDGKKGLFWSSDDPINEEWVGLSGQCGVPLARHVKPDSWERIIEDAQADGVRYHNDGRPSDFDALVERCKRLAGEGA